MYQVYYPEERRVFLSRDIIFDEGNNECFAPIEVEETFDSDEDIADAPAAEYSTTYREHSVYDTPEIIPETEEETEGVQPRRSERQSKPSRKVRENAAQVCAMAFNAAAVTGHREVSYKEATTGPNKKRWRETIQAQYDAYVASGTWQVVEYTPGMNLLSGHWVLVEKPERLKARWVVHGNKQIKGLDYNEVYASTAKSGSIRFLLAITAIEGLETAQLDAVDAFLNSHLAELVYMMHPTGFSRPGTCCRLLKALFGLCQSPREWWRDISRKLAEMGFKQCQADHSVYVNPEGVVIIVYVDDIALFADSTGKIESAKTQLMSAYKMRDIGDLQVFTGIQILRLPGKVFIHQKDYALNILEKFGFATSKTVRVPFDEKVVLQPRDDVCPEGRVKEYQEKNGSLGWLSNMTRPDMAFTISKLSQFNANPPDLAFECQNHVFRYLNGTPDLGILFDGEGCQEPQGYTDSNWGDTDPQDKRSTSGMVYLLANGPISWQARKQRTTATSSTEAEYVAQCGATKEAVYLRQFMAELQRSIKGPTSVYADNTSAIALAQNQVQHARTRHIDFQYHYTREKVSDGTVIIDYIPTQDMIADGLTKPLGPTKFTRFKQQLGMTSLASLGQV
jgi:hypothetical protein